VLTASPAPRFALELGSGHAYDVGDELPDR
jgi:hypothetical protein